MQSFAPNLFRHGAATFARSFDESIEIHWNSLKCLSSTFRFEGRETMQGLSNCRQFADNLKTVRLQNNDRLAEGARLEIRPDLSAPKPSRPKRTRLIDLFIDLHCSETIFQIRFCKKTISLSLADFGLQRSPTKRSFPSFTSDKNCNRPRSFWKPCEPLSNSFRTFWGREFEQIERDRWLEFVVYWFK